MSDHRPDLLLDAAARAVRYLETSPDRAVSPDTQALAGLDRFDPTLPADPTAASDTLELLDRLGSPATMVSNGGRYFGFVTGGSLPATTAASILATAWDQNAALPAMSPVAARLDSIAASWLVELLGLPATAVAAFCGGASVANLSCLVMARDAVLADVGWDVGANGLTGAPPIQVIAGAEAHASMTKAIGLAGLGRDRTLVVPCDDQGRMDLDRFPTITGPTIVLLQAGNVNTGASDSFERIQQWRDAGAWVHVDGAFGLWAAVSNTRADQVEGVGLADSWATDAHKWLNVPYDAGVAVVADHRALTRSMGTEAAYLVGSGPADLDQPFERRPMQMGLQMSQQARGVLVWAALHSLGRSGVADLIDRNCALARRMADRLISAGAVVPHEVVLNQVLVQFDDDAVTDRVIDGIGQGSALWAGGTTWQGRRCLRLSVSNWETTDADIDAASDELVALWRSL